MSKEMNCRSEANCTISTVGIVMLTSYDVYRAIYRAIYREIYRAIYRAIYREIYRAIYRAIYVT